MPPMHTPLERDDGGVVPDTHFHFINEKIRTLIATNTDIYSFFKHICSIFSLPYPPRFGDKSGFVLNEEA